MNKTIKNILKYALALILIGTIVVVTAGCLNFGVQPGNGFYIIAAIANICIGGFALYKLMKWDADKNLNE